MIRRGPPFELKTDTRGQSTVNLSTRETRGKGKPKRSYTTPRTRSRKCNGRAPRKDADDSMRRRRDTYRISSLSEETRHRAGYRNGRLRERPPLSLFPVQPPAPLTFRTLSRDGERGFAFSFADDCRGEVGEKTLFPPPRPCRHRFAF